MIRFQSFPSTKPPPEFVSEVVTVFENHSVEIGEAAGGNRFGSDKVLALLRSGLSGIGFEVEDRAESRKTIDRPVFFGEGGVPSLRYRVDAYNEEWRCGLEVEAGRGLQGNAFYRDLVQAMVMVHVDHLIIALLNHYRGGQGSEDYKKAVSIASTLFGHDRIVLPFGLTVLGYGPDKP